MNVTYMGLLRAGLSHDQAQRALFSGQTDAVRTHIAAGHYDAPTKDLAALLLLVAAERLNEAVSESDEELSVPLSGSPSTSPGASSLG